LPDGCKPKSQFGYPYILEGLGRESVGCILLEYLGPFGICYDQFGILYHEKSGNPGIEPDFVQTGL
jgi:hypothetical protein